MISQKRWRLLSIPRSPLYERQLLRFNPACETVAKTCREIAKPHHVHQPAGLSLPSKLSVVVDMGPIILQQYTACTLNHTYLTFADRQIDVNDRMWLSRCVL